MAVDPNSEIVTATTVTPGNASDGSVAVDRIGDLVDRNNSNDDASSGETTDGVISDDVAPEADAGAPIICGDSAYGTGEIQSRFEDKGFESKCKTQKPTTQIGFLAKDRFVVNLEDDTVTSPNGVTVTIRRHVKGAGWPSSPSRVLRAHSGQSAPSRPKDATSPSG